jgi:16S rRNA (uracil1498-N3)-methyltransferase
LTISRIYFPRKMEAGEQYELTGENRRYAATVLRMKKGDHLLLFDGMGCEYEAAIIGYDRERISLEIISREAIHEQTINITLAQSLPKAKKMDFIIEKACELGAVRIIPFVSARSVPRLPQEKASVKHVRWQKIAVEAARKCHSNSIPEIGNISTFAEMLRSAGSDAVKIIFWEEEVRRNMKEVLREDRGGKAGDFFLIVGPEGGFTREEIESAEGMGFVSVSLGRQILKVETAALAILSIIQYERGMFGSDVEGGAEP